MEKEVKTQIVKSAQSVKRKFKQLKDIDYDNDLIFGKVKPLTGPLKTMAAENKVNNDDSTSTSLNSMQKSDSLKKEKLINTLEADSYSPIEKDESDNEGDESSEASFKTLESNHSPRQDSSAWSVIRSIQECTLRCKAGSRKTYARINASANYRRRDYRWWKKYVKSPGLVELLLKKYLI